MLINSDSSCKSKVYPALLFSFKMEVWSDKISDWDTTPADKCVSQPPLFCARFSKLGHRSRFTIEYVRTLEKLDLKNKSYSSSLTLHRNHHAFLLLPYLLPKE